MPSVPHDLFKNFLARVDKSAGDDACWMWTGAPDREGYGLMYTSIDGVKRHYRSNRLSYLIHVGNIPDGMIVCHACDNPGCVNPAHLFIGSPAENTHDMLSKGRGGMRNLRNGRAKITEDDVRQIRILRAQGVRSRVLADRYGISSSMVDNIVRRHSWKHVV